MSSRRRKEKLTFPWNHRWAALSTYANRYLRAMDGTWVCMLIQSRLYVAHDQRGSKDMLTEIAHTSKKLTLLEAAHNHCPIQGFRPYFLNVFLWEAGEGKAQGRSTGTTLITGLKGTKRLDLKVPCLEFTPSSGILNIPHTPPQAPCLRQGQRRKHKQSFHFP